LRAQFGGLCFELFDGEPFDQRGIVEEAVFIAGKRSRVMWPPAAS
jgi:hypothetical protein